MVYFFILMFPVFTNFATHLEIFSIALNYAGKEKACFLLKGPNPATSYLCCLFVVQKSTSRIQSWIVGVEGEEDADHSTTTTAPAQQVYGYSVNCE